MKTWTETVAWKRLLRLLMGLVCFGPTDSRCGEEQFVMGQHTGSPWALPLTASVQIGRQILMKKQDPVPQATGEPQRST